MYGPDLGYGWLPRYLGPHPSLNGVKIGRHFPTRWEEYAFAVEALDHFPALKILDAGTGFNPEIHLLSCILAANPTRTVYAVDANPKTLELPPAPNIHRSVQDMLKLEFPDKSFDAYACISTLEHLTSHEQMLALGEAHRVLKPDGLLVLTADWIPPKTLGYDANLAGFDVGYDIPFHGERLDPHVSFLRARKLG